MKNLMIRLIAATVLAGTVYLVADDDDDRHGQYTNKMNVNTQPVVNSVQQKLYVKECASCHMAYQPEFLPKRPWDKMMNTLGDHFGVDATVEEADKKTLRIFLAENAADSKPVGKHYRKMAASIGRGEEVLRISQTPYFKKEHRRIPERFIVQEEVKSIANCTACHQQAAAGDYRERHINIPNYGRWDD